MRVEAEGKTRGRKPLEDIGLVLRQGQRRRGLAQRAEDGSRLQGLEASYERRRHLDHSVDQLSVMADIEEVLPGVGKGSFRGMDIHLMPRHIQGHDLAHGDAVDVGEPVGQG